MNHKLTTIIPLIMISDVSESNPQRYEIHFINYTKTLNRVHVNTIEEAHELKNMWMNDILQPAWLLPIIGGEGEKDVG